MPYENLIVETRDGIAFVTVNRPDKMNALNGRTIEELEAAFAAIQGDDSVRGVCLTGSGEKAFVAGADIAELSKQSPIEGKTYGQRGQRVFDRIEHLGKPVAAALHGVAPGGGGGLGIASRAR